MPLLDFAAASIALTAVALTVGANPFPALPLTPLLLVMVYGALGVYGGPPSRGGLRVEDRQPWPVIMRILMATLFVWSTELLIPLDGPAQLQLWGAFLLLDVLGHRLGAHILHRLDRTERWVLVGDESTAQRLRAYQPLRAYASVVSCVSASDDGSQTAGRVAALEAVERYRADRVVIASQYADDERLLDVVRAFKSTGVPVSLLPRPLDLLEAPATRPSQVGGVALIDVQALAAHRSVPYAGPDRRHDRRTRVSVVVPAINEEGNIEHVLRGLPDDLHEVILVDGNSSDGTIESARRAYPKIRVLTQNGRGKGAALRTGFAAVTGNLVVMLDADGSADPAEIPRFVAALEAGSDFAKGSRFLEGGGSADITVIRKLGNAFLSGTANALHGTHFTDLCYGYNAFWTRCLPFIALDVPGFEVETLINMRIAAAGMKITEVPSYEAHRISGQSNLNTFRDGFRVLATILSEARRGRGFQPEPSTVPEAAGRQQAGTAVA